jgi:hypothetical protein
MSLAQVIESETGIRVQCLSVDEAASFRKDHAGDEDPDPAIANSILFLGPPDPKVWIGHGVTAHMDERQLATVAGAGSCDGLVASTAEALGIVNPDSGGNAGGVGGSVVWPLLSVLVLTGLLVAAIRWQIVRKRRADWVEAPIGRDEESALAPVKDGETATEAAHGVVEGGSRAPTRRES